MDLLTLMLILGLAILWELATINKNVKKMNEQNAELINLYNERRKRIQ
ncbi:YrzO family protein [Peribacillus simplex]|uniref:YrzO family protein n=1 Tax=Peribacillus simplex TaxID=1478 RepID=A0AAN2TUT6_9BACI|nr:MULTISPECIES: YrzO family protein [Bacillaceae]MBD8590020.1 YrzO family protein [Peribacillus simplex]MCF7624385.1 YrzO family protein [Peribacillus frigoritolerans]MCP1154952.1 YrzO family protein [Peribacillus frigoritolerans]MCT1390698.1 YrzO family protein [Peribacillus frigoritolerans]MEA3575946.1 YrzO family protein [Peribacillus frigoritolerans]